MAEPVTLAQIKLHLDIARDDQDDMLTGMIVAAREWVENFTGLTITDAGTTQVSDSFARVGNLVVSPEGESPVVTIDYVDANGEPATITNARLWRVSRPARVMPAMGEAWPAVPGTVAVTVPGVPFSLLAAIKLLVGNLYANRESTVTGTIVADTGAIENLCRPYRLPVIG